jgi:ABC-type polysaccharide/polyol phosphate export permease
MDIGSQKEKLARKLTGKRSRYKVASSKSDARGALMGQLMREIQKNRELIWALALKELRVRYKRSALGFLWALLHPLLMMIILTIVFSRIMRFPVHHFAIFLISALLPWTFFSQSLAYSVESLVGNGDLFKKVNVAKSVFPVAAVLSNVINFLFSLVPLVLLLLFFRFPFYWTWLYLPVPFLALVLFTLGCSFFFAMANVFFRDVSHILQVVLSGWFYVSPIIYSLDFLPERYRFFFHLNPMIYPLHGFRMAIYYGQLPSPQSVAMSLACGIVALFIGYSVFRRYQEVFVFYV